MKTPEEIQSIVCTVLSEAFEVDTPVTPETNLQQLGFEWLDAIETCILLEEQFSIEISDDDADKVAGFVTAKDWVEWITEILNRNNT
jgi:acyl carrier protein